MKLSQMNDKEAIILISPEYPDGECRTVSIAKAILRAKWKEGYSAFETTPATADIPNVVDWVVNDLTEAIDRHYDDNELWSDNPQNSKKLTELAKYLEVVYDARLRDVNFELYDWNLDKEIEIDVDAPVE